VPPHERFQGRRLAAADEALQELSLGQVRPFRQQGAAKVLDDLAHRLGRHPRPRAGVLFPLQVYYPLQPILSMFFSRPVPFHFRQERKGKLAGSDPFPGQGFDSLLQLSLWPRSITNGLPQKSKHWDLADGILVGGFRA
jgi:hypothetical protein